MGRGGRADAAMTSSLPRPAAPRRYAVLQCAVDSEYVKRAHGSYFHVYLSLMREDGEEWHLYRAYDGKLPGKATAGGEGGDEDQDLDAYDGFVVTGSCADAHSDEPWVVALVEMLGRAVEKGKKVLGICFGHQVLCRALGGRTGRSANGWDVGVTCVHPTPSAANLFAALGIPEHLPVLQFHRDEVLELPPQAEALGTSGRTGVEMFRYGDIAFGIQGHPEYTAGIADDFIDRLHSAKLIKESHVEAARGSLGAWEPCSDEWRRLCRALLKGRLQQ